MTKERIISLFEEEYSKSVAQTNDRVLRNKLLYTSQQFARNFEYHLPPERGIKRKFICFAKRCIIKSTCFILQPYATQMLKFQKSSCELIGMLIERMQQLSDRIDNQEGIIAQLQAERHS